MTEKVDKAWLDVARDLGKTDRDGEVYLLRVEIERLRKTAIETMQEMLRRANEIERWQAQSIAQYAEIKRLRVENKRLRGWIAPDILELTAELEQLRAVAGKDTA